MNKQVGYVLGLLAVAVVVSVVFTSMKGEENEKYVGLSECPTGFSLYDMTLVDYSFCYDSDLGTAVEKETSVDPSARRGTAYTVSFENSDDLIFVETKDFALTGDRDVPPTLKGGYECLVAAADDAALEECFYDDVIYVDAATDSQGRKQVSAHLRIEQFEGGTVDRNYLFIPDVRQDGDYNLHASSSDLPEGIEGRWGMQALLF